MGKTNINDVIKETVKETIKEVMSEMDKEPAPAQDRNYFKDTEKLLYAYPALKFQIKEREKDIEDLKREGYTDKSKDIVMIPKGGPILNGREIQAERIKSRMASLEKTKREVARIERGLEKINDDPGYPIIELKYFSDDNMTNQQIAKEVNYSVRTVIRHKNRLINKLKIIFFGVDALDLS